MKIRRLLVERFRGIKKLDWSPNSDCICLIGPGDSRKSTVLDAIDLALTPRSSAAFDDSDFYQLKTEDSISITVSIIQIPDELMTEKKFGLFLSGYGNGECHDEFQDGDEPMLTIRLTVDKSLEPEWMVINKQHPEGHYISGRDREKLGVMRLGVYVNHHLTWRHGTMLSRLTGELDDIDLILAEASRAARQKISVDTLVKFKDAAKKAEDLGKALGVLPQSAYMPNLDAGAVSIRESGFTLHDGDVPIRRVGLGARRLLIMAIQTQLAASGGIVLIDEFEHGLEPHRIRHLLRKFEKQAKIDSFGQVILTSHAPAVLEELPRCLHVVRSGDFVEIDPSPENLVATIRKAPEAILGHKIIVCEGKTEVGICRAYDEWLINEEKDSFACRGVVPVEGGGDNAVRIAKDLCSLGYQVLYLGDSDTKDTIKKTEEMEKLGITVLTWKDELSVEERVFNDLNWSGVVEALQLAADERGAETIRDSVATRAAKKPLELGDHWTWEESPELRSAIGLTAKQQGWFKRIELGEYFGRIVVKHLATMATKDVEDKLQSLRTWIE